MIRKIVSIDAGLCTGCGDCVTACHEGAIVMRDGRAVLLRDDYCDGLGDCLPACPAGAISFEEREAIPYDEAAVAARRREQIPVVCGSHASGLSALTPLAVGGSRGGTAAGVRPGNWPVQLRLVSAAAPFLPEADLLVAADCAAYAHSDFHREFMAGRVTLIGCPKLDAADYAAKLRDILVHNAIRSLTLVRMRVPCCGALERAAVSAIADAGGTVPLKVAVLDTDGSHAAESGVCSPAGR